VGGAREVACGLRLFVVLVVFDFFPVCTDTELNVDGWPLLVSNVGSFFDRLARNIVDVW